MSRSDHRSSVRTLYGVLLIAIFLVAAACNESATPTIEQLPVSTPTEQVTDSHASIPKISPGQHLRFDSISIDDGLSQSSVFSILQDSRGYMWFGTEDGLNKYDGYNFTIYKHDPDDPDSLISNWIQTLFEDDSGMLWIGTQDGLDRFDPETETFVHYRNGPNDPDSLSDNAISTIYQDRGSTLWIGTGYGGLNRYDPENDSFIDYQSHPKGLSSNSVSVIFEDQEGMLWIGTSDKGLNRFYPEENQWEHFSNDPNDPNSLSHNNVSAISADKDGTLWIGTDGGGINKLILSDVNELDQENTRFQHFQNDLNIPESLRSNDVFVVYHDQNDILWIGTRSGGLSVLNTEKGTFTHYQNIPGDAHSLSDNWVMSIFQDREGVLWFGSVGGGINKLNLGWRNFALYKNNPDNPNGLSNNMVRTFYPENADTLWVGSMFGGLDRFDRKSENWTHYRNVPNDSGSLSSDFVSTIFEDSLGVLWIGTQNGLERFDPGTQSFTRYKANPDGLAGSHENNVRAIIEMSEGKFWIGTMSGLYHYDHDNNHWAQFKKNGHSDSHDLSSAWIMGFLQDTDENIWISTGGAGLFLIDPKTEYIIHFHNAPDDPTSLSNNYVLANYQDRDGTLWFGTLEGLNRYDPATETFTHYRGKDGLPNETIYCLTEDEDGHLWMSTNLGLSRFDPDSETFANFNVSDGLQSNEFNATACAEGENGDMFFGGIEGFNIFSPKNIQENLTIPPVVLTTLKFNGENVHQDSIKDVTLKWPDNAFEFEYSALSFAQSEKNQYAYYLEGFEESWNYVGTRRFGGYTNLPGGSYTLHIKGSNNDGVWNETGTSVKINIIPPFWATWWFRGIVIVSFLGIVYGGYHLRIRTLQARERDLESQVEQRTNELIETQKILRKSEMEKAIASERNRLARELHDSVTQSLYSLTLFSEAARHLADEQGLESIEKQIKQIGIIGLQALKEMRLLVYELQPPELERDGLIRALRRRLDAVEGRAGVDARIEVEEFARLPGYVEQELFRIAQEALNNALKHAAASSMVVHLRLENECIEMEIIDDGIGFDPLSLPDRGGMGLKSIRERAERLGGDMELQTDPGEGTSVKISIKDINSAQQRGEIDE
ncbi:MAG: hypothetical protein ISR58_20245 [Anaerolineales bacterium]|nr:hypothetical protein [Chloroflexota bacterium]MBL6983518.1 hypothetical protein [Anaerolineales bacterium]